MGVTELAIEAHEKGEVDHDTIHQILISSDRYSITKKSLVNDLSEDFLLGVESKQQLPSLKGGDGGREKSTLAASDGPRHLKIMTRMPTMNVTYSSSLLFLFLKELPSWSKLRQSTTKEIMCRSSL